MPPAIIQNKKPKKRKYFLSFFNRRKEDCSNATENEPNEPVHLPPHPGEDVDHDEQEKNSLRKLDGKKWYKLLKQPHKLNSYTYKSFREGSYKNLKDFILNKNLKKIFKKKTHAIRYFLERLLEQPHQKPKDKHCSILYLLSKSKEGCNIFFNILKIIDYYLTTQQKKDLMHDEALGEQLMSSLTSRSKNNNSALLGFANKEEGIKALSMLQGPIKCHLEKSSKKSQFFLAALAHNPFETNSLNYFPPFPPILYLTSYRLGCKLLKSWFYSLELHLDEYPNLFLQALITQTLSNESPLFCLIYNTTQYSDKSSGELLLAIFRNKIFQQTLNDQPQFSLDFINALMNNISRKNEKDISAFSKLVSHMKYKKRNHTSPCQPMPTSARQCKAIYELLKQDFNLVERTRSTFGAGHAYTRVLENLEGQRATRSIGCTIF
jgi:hypothetical protein